MEETYSKASLMTALYVAISVSFCLPHHVAGSAFYHLSTFISGILRYINT